MDRFSLQEVQLGEWSNLQHNEKHIGHRFARIMDLKLVHLTWLSAFKKKVQAVKALYN